MINRIVPLLFLSEPLNGKGAAMHLEKFIKDIFLPAIRIRKRSWHVDERIILKYILPAFGHKKASSLSLPDMERWFFDLADRGLSNSSLNRILSVLRNIFSHARHHGLLKNSPDRFLKPFPSRPGLVRFLNCSEAGLLWRELQKHKHRSALALRLILLTGCRKNEILKARWEHIDLERSFLLVPLSKSGRPRHVPLCAEAKKILETLKSQAQSPWLFPGRNGQKPISDIYYFWNKIRKNLNMHNVRIHDLRHTFASLLLAAGHSLYEAQTILGHADSRSTSIYAHLANDSLIQAAGNAAAMFMGNEAEQKNEPAWPNGLEYLFTQLLDDACEKFRDKLAGELKKMGKCVLLKFQCR